MDSSWKNLQIRMEAAWNMRTTPKTKRPKTGDIICIAYHGVNNITVEFEDGFVLYHARWKQFVRGALHHNQKNINE